MKKGKTAWRPSLSFFTSLGQPIARWTRKAESTLRFARSGFFRLDLHQQLAVLHLVALGRADAAHDAIDTGLERMLHLHGFQHHQQLALGDAGSSEERRVGKRRR